MYRLLLCQAVTLSLLSVTAFSAPPRSASDKVDFQRQVRPILSENCFLCHGPDGGTRMAGLRLDTNEGAFSKRSSGTTIVPGDPEASLFYQRITHQNEVLRMPPVHSKRELTVEQIDVLRRWIEAGASWDQHWSFETLQRPEPPQVDKASWIRNPLDRFILKQLEQDGLAPAPEADKRTLARRVALDLTGLPPDPGVLETFLSDTSASAYEKLVDKLLKSKHWGEHRGRYWLDAARYGDTHGLHVDNYREMWPYRDWVIQAFNRNQPFDQFTVEQLAGDLLPDPTLDQRVATGFHRSNVTTNEAGPIPAEYEAIYAKDRADTTGLVWLGLTVGCATCHDHKFDPISQKDFYSMTAFFRNTTQYVMDGNVADSAPIVVVPRAGDRDHWRELEQKADDVKGRREKVSAAAEGKFETWLKSGAHRSLKTPLDESSEILTLSMASEARAARRDGLNAIEFSGDVKLGEGPEEGQPALHFDDQSWAELPNLELDARKPFSIALWFLQPLNTGNVVVMSQTDPDDHKRGWSIDIGARRPKFKMFGDNVEATSAQSKLEVGAGPLEELQAGTWNRLAVSYDGSGERAGLNYYLNGEMVPTLGSEYFTSLEGNILTGQPLLLGKQTSQSGDGYEESYFTGGAIADLRVFDRAISLDEARLVSLWPVLSRARGRTSLELSKEQREALRFYFLNLKDSDYRELLVEQREIELEQREIRRRGAVTHVMQERAEHMPSAHILNRGLYDQPGEEVEASTPGTLPRMPAAFPRNRLGLARWLVDDSNPLTARVTVNRFWQQVFGSGIVTTSDDFGSQGEPPTHPELLDWLAVEFRESGWDVKDFFRIMVTSSTYRQSSETTEAKAEKDADNRLLSRGPRFRMDGEMVRDYALAASGLLVRKIGGPSVKPYQPEGVWESVAMTISNTRHYKQDAGDKLYRRSMYTFWKRAAPPASMDIFNAPTREHSIVRRERTNTPLQALVTMNDPQFVEAARHLAQKAMREAGDDFDRQLDYLSTRLLARDFGEQERAVARRTYDGFVGYYGEHGQDAEKLLSTGESAPDEALPAVESAALTMVANQIINLDEVLNK